MASWACVGIVALLLASAGELRAQPRESGAGQSSTPGAAHGAAPASQPAAPRLVPWIEADGKGAGEIGNIVAGLEYWRAVTDTAIVSLNPGNASLYPLLERRVPGMRIIPGLKTWPLLTTFDSESGWQRVAQEAERFSAAAGEKAIVLENETALRPFLEGKADIDLAALRRGLDQLPRELEILWYPGIHGHARLKNERSTAVCEQVAAACRVRFLDTDNAAPNSHAEWWSGAARSRMRALSSQPTLPILYTDGDFWPPERILEAVANTGSEIVVIYPGAKAWQANARIIADVVSAHVRQAASAAPAPRAQP